MLDATIGPRKSYVFIEFKSDFSRTVDNTSGNPDRASGKETRAESPRGEEGPVTRRFCFCYVSLKEVSAKNKENLSRLMYDFAPLDKTIGDKIVLKLIPLSKLRQKLEICKSPQPSKNTLLEDPRIPRYGAAIFLSTVLFFALITWSLLRKYHHCPKEK